MKILAFDSATSSCSVALRVDKQDACRYELAPKQHSQLLLPMADSLLDAAGLNLADVDLLTFAHGPGSFTGLRLTSAIVQALALAHDLPIIGVDSLQLLAQSALREHAAEQMIVATAARREQVHAATLSPSPSSSGAPAEDPVKSDKSAGLSAFADNDESGRAMLDGRRNLVMEIVQETHLQPIKDFISNLPSGGYLAVGDAWALAPLQEAALKNNWSILTDITPKAQDLLELAEYHYKSPGEQAQSESGLPEYVYDYVVD